MSEVLDAAYTLVHKYPGGAESLAPRMGKLGTSLSHEVKRVGTAKFGLEDAVLASVLSNDPRILNAFAKEMGCFVLPLSPVVGLDAFHGLSDAAREFGEFVSSVADAAADNRITANELARVDRELGDLIARSQAVRATLATMHEAGKPRHMKQQA